MKYLSHILQKFIEPSLPKAFVSKDHKEKIKLITDRLPLELFRFFVYECRLGADRDFPVDFSLAIFRQHITNQTLQTIIHQHQSSNIALWQQIQGFITEWLQKGSLLHQHIPHIWWGEDLHQKNMGFAPNLCVSIQNNSNHALYPQIIQHFPLEYTIIAPILQRCLYNLPASSRLCYMSYMFARDVQETLRIGVGAMKAEEVIQYLHTIGWTPSHKRFYTIIRQLGKLGNNQFLIDLDIDAHGVQAPISVQYMIHSKKFSLDKNPHNFYQVLDYLVEENLCTLPQASALRKYSTLQQVHLDTEEKEAMGIRQNMNNVLDCFAFDTHVIKLSDTPHKPIQAKTYLRAWYHPLPAFFLKSH